MSDPFLGPAAEINLGGRPSSYTDEIADRICEELCDGRSLVDICKPDDMPNRSTVFRWLADERYATFRAMYAHAREVQAEYLADEIIEISDDGRNDWMERNGENNEGWQTNGEALQRSKLRVDARKWIASKLKPRKYGDLTRTELSGPGGKPIETKDVSASDKLKSMVGAMAPATDAPTE